MTKETKFDRSVVNDLLASAKTHFLENGYEKASLRKICSSAGVTTGALYFSFANKEALFDALIGPTLQKIDAVLDDLEQKVLKEKGKNFDANRFNDFIFRFLVDNKDGIRLLMETDPVPKMFPFFKIFFQRPWRSARYSSSVSPMRRISWA